VFTTTGGLTPTPFTLDDDADAAHSNTQAYTNIQTFTAYTISEATVSGWTLSFGNPVCTVGSPNSGTQSVSSATLTVDLKEGENVSCTFINTRQPAHLTVIKHVINNNGGTKIASDFTMNVTGTNPSSASFAGAESPGTIVTLDPGSYSVDETALPGYTKSLSADCSGTIGPGDSKTCTITNKDIQPLLTIIKHVVNNNGGTAAATNFRVHCLADNAAGGTLVVTNAATTALATAISVTLALTTQTQLTCNGTFVPSGAGTFIIRGAQAAHSTGTLTIDRGSWISIRDANPL